jgi:NDP-sugar pyrophosphorylase family protein
MTVATFKNAAPEFVAVVLAGTVGARLFPMTSAQHPKHMMPICGVPVVFRLLRCLEASGFSECVVAIAVDDDVTIPALQKEEGFVEVTTTPNLVVQSVNTKMKVTVLVLGDECPGSVEVLRQVEGSVVIPKSSNIVVFPGDLVVFEASAVQKLVDTHRQGKSTACTMLLADVAEEDEHGVPLKESAKQKKGGLAREEEDIDYIALSYTSTDTSTPGQGPPPRVVWKQPKIDVEHDEDMVGTTPKLVLPKPRLRHGVTRVRTEWSDLHVYAFSPWVRRLILSRKNLLSVQADLLPLLIARQFRGVVATFGSKADKEILDDVLRTDPSLGSLGSRGPEQMGYESPRSSLVSVAAAAGAAVSNSLGEQNPEYTIVAHVQESALRASTIASYLYASKDVVTRAIHSTKQQSDKNDDPCLFLPKDTILEAKFHSIVLPENEVGDKKLTFKSSCVGRRCKLGDKCRLNNVVIMDDVAVGDNAILQNTIIGAGCKIGDNCNLNDCQISPGKIIPSGTKAKSESFVLDDAMES